MNEGRRLFVCIFAGGVAKSASKSELRLGQNNDQTAPGGRDPWLEFPRIGGLRGQRRSVDG